VPRDPDHDLTLESGATARVWVGDCRKTLAEIPEVARSEVDLVFADPPFNWARDYNKHARGNSETNQVWDDARMSASEYLAFTQDWLDLCVNALSERGAMWVNIPDDWAAEIVVHLKGRGLKMINWCVWHYRFGQNTRARFISSKVHALYFARDERERVWNPDEVLEISDRKAIYADPRTDAKRDGSPPGQRVPMDVWYGPYWGRIQGNNKERRAQHDNQLPEVYLHRVIASTSDKDAVVLDPFLGSGTTGVVACAMGRHFIGTEYSADNARAAVERIERGPVRAFVEPGRVSSAIHPPRRAPAGS